MIDWNKVTELREEIGEEDFAEVVELFMEEVDGAIGDLRAGIADGEFESSLHFLKGSALNLGFSAFSDLCAEGEIAAARGDYHLVDPAAIIEVYDRSRATFLAELKTRFAA